MIIIPLLPSFWGIYFRKVLLHEFFHVHLFYASSEFKLLWKGHRMIRSIVQMIYLWLIFFNSLSLLSDDLTLYELLIIIIGLYSCYCLMFSVYFFLVQNKSYTFLLVCCGCAIWMFWYLSCAPLAVHLIALGMNKSLIFTHLNHFVSFVSEYIADHYRVEYLPLVLSQTND